MAAIDRTAYPRFPSSLTAHELQTLYRPTDEEQRFVAQYARGDTGHFTLLTLLKCHQNLGYTPALTDVPRQICTYLSQHLPLRADTALEGEAEKTLYRYRQRIRSSLRVSSYAFGGAETVESIVEHAAYTMSDPADLINVAIEHLVEQRFELPAFRTLDRLVGRVRHHVHHHLYAQITQALSPTQVGRLEALVGVHNGRTEFTRIKAVPRGVCASSYPRPDIMAMRAATREPTAAECRPFMACQDRVAVVLTAANPATYNRCTLGAVWNTRCRPSQKRF